MFQAKFTSNLRDLSENAEAAEASAEEDTVAVAAATVAETEEAATETEDTRYVCVCSKEPQLIFFSRKTTLELILFSFFVKSLFLNSENLLR